MDMGNVPAWVSAVAGVVALVAAVLAARFTWLALVRERERDVERRERDQRVQASKVTAWLVTIVADEFRYRGQDFDGPDWGVRLSNTSDEAVYEMGIHVERPGPDGVNWSGAERLRVVPPRTTTDVPIPLAPVDLDVTESVVTLSFRDSAGELWTREVDGQLTSRGRVLAAPTR